MIDFEVIAPAAGGLHTAHRARLACHRGKPALAPCESNTLLGADHPHRHVTSESIISMAERSNTPGHLDGVSGSRAAAYSRTALAVSSVPVDDPAFVPDRQAAMPARSYWLIASWSRLRADARICETRDSETPSWRPISAPGIWWTCTEVSTCS